MMTPDKVYTTLLEKSLCLGYFLRFYTRSLPDIINDFQHFMCCMKTLENVTIPPFLPIKEFVLLVVVVVF